MMLRRHFTGDDRGSLPMVMLVISIGLALSAMLAPLVIRQVTTTRGFIDRTDALNGAQIGLDVVMARVRAASDDDANGLLERLPTCSITGDAAVPNTGTKLPYTVTIEYRDQDGQPLACPLTTVPTTAKVTSVGSGNSGKRTLTATYVFSTSNTNIPGGAIRISSPATNTLCMDAGTKIPTAGTAVLMNYCNGSSTQQFGYTPDLYLKLVNSESSSATYGMCLFAGASHVSGNPLVFQPCPSTTRTTTFQWSLDGNSLFHSTSPSSGIENLCVSLKSAGAVGSPVLLGSCSINAAINVWRSAPGVGAGMAGDSTNQLVNYAQFSRCLDVTNKEPGSSYMIAWFCKQSPNGVVDWNQIWVHPVPVAPAVFKTGVIETTKGTGKYCLRSPLSTATNIYVTTIECTTANRTRPDVQWTVYHDTGVYATSYRIMDSAGNCLAPTDLNATVKDTHTDGTSKVKVVKCSSSELQKWNAPANINQPTPITDVTEQ